MREDEEGPYGGRAQAVAICVTPEVLTWDVCVVRVDVGSDHFVVCLAGDEYEQWMQRYEDGALDDELRGVAARKPAGRLRSVPRSVRTAQRHRHPRVGVEHEFCVSAAGEVIDFRTVLPALFPGHPRADPTDRFAVRLPAGVVTADQREAEIATVPVPIDPGFARRTSDVAAGLQLQLRDEAGSQRQLLGYSTHISASWQPRRDNAASRTWARVFAPVMMLLLDQPSSPGLLVRPRPGRLEICGDYCSGDRLAGAVAFAAASARTVQRLSKEQRAAWSVDVSLVAAVERFGWYVDRRAFGVDLYAHGASSRLRRRCDTVTASDHAFEVSEEVRRDLADIGGDDDVLVFDDALRALSQNDFIRRSERVS